jgi:hypothetical protein
METVSSKGSEMDAFQVLVVEVMCVVVIVLLFYNLCWQAWWWSSTMLEIIWAVLSVLLPFLLEARGQVVFDTQ